MSALFVAALVVAPAVSGEARADYRVVEIDRREAFAGKLGKRVSESWVVERDGKRFTVRFSVRHTLMGDVKAVSVGDRVSLAGHRVGDRITANRADVR